MSVDNKFLVRDKITLKVTGLGSSGEGVIYGLCTWRLSR